MYSRGEPVDLVRAVLVGRPNTGKSSLFNALVGRDTALVSHHAGTTRDYLTADLDLDGVRCRLIDTAGIGSEQRASPQGVDLREIEDAAQCAAKAQQRSADVQILCLDGTRPLDDWERERLEAAPLEGQRIVALTKCDVRRGATAPGRCPGLGEPSPLGVMKPLRGSPAERDITGIETSSLTGEGIETLRGELRRQAIAAAGAQGDVVASTAARCGESLRLAGQSLQRARGVAQSGQEELAAAEIRVALDELGKVVGAVYTDDLLDRIFSRFCIGK
jgi:tRNA modification GTPase